MAVDPNLNVNYAAGVQTNIDTALTTAQTAVETTIGQPLNLSDEERKTTPSIDEQRELYVKKAIEVLGPQNPNLLGPEITLARVINLWQFRNANLEIIPRVQALLDLLIDSSINAENICLKFTEDLRDNALRYKDRNVQGADTVYDELKGLHTQTPTEEQP